MDEYTARRLLRIEHKLTQIGACIGFIVLLIVAGTVYWSSRYVWHIGSEAAGWLSLIVALIAGALLGRAFHQHD